MVKDKAEEIDKIEWTVFGKIKTITRIAGSNKPDLEFKYDATAVRIAKIEKTKLNGILRAPADWNYKYYTRDAQGNTMAVYEKSSLAHTTAPADLFLIEQDLYGSSRLGLSKNGSTGTDMHATSMVVYVLINIILKNDLYKKK